ncbi:MAG: hypothetical protein ACLFU0_12035 [Alphaproteobacteria bacterium]
MRPPHDLLRAQLDRETRGESSLVGRLVRWLSTDSRAVGRLRFELERCRLHHAHELNRLRTLVESGTGERFAAAARRGLDAEAWRED